MQQQTAHLAGDQRVKFFTGRLWSHLFGRTSGRWRPTAGHRAGRADGKPVAKRKATMQGLPPFPPVPTVNSLVCGLALVAMLASNSMADVVWSFTADPPSGWTELSTGTQNLDMGTYLMAESEATPDGMYSPAYDLAGWTSVTVTGRVATYGSGTARPIVIDVSTNGGAAWHQSVTSATPSSTTYINTGTMSITLTLTAQTVFRVRSGGTSGRDVRMQNFVCQGTPPAASVPTLSSPTATSIGQTGATLGANVTDDGGAALSSRGTVYGAATDPTGNGLAEGGTATGVFTDERTGLSQGTKYFYRGYAVNSEGTGYSPNGSFHTEPAKARPTSASGWMWARRPPAFSG